MHTHLGDFGLDIDDPISNSFFKDIWLKTVYDNCAAYSSLDGIGSLDLLATLEQYQWTLNNLPPIVYDDVVRGITDTIKGHLVLWPSKFLAKEDLGPTIATRALVPNDLWV